MRIRGRIYRHLAVKELGMSEQDAASMSDDEGRRAMFEHWYVTHCFGKESKAASMSEDAFRRRTRRCGGQPVP